MLSNPLKNSVVISRSFVYTVTAFLYQLQTSCLTNNICRQRLALLSSLFSLNCPILCSLMVSILPMHGLKFGSLIFRSAILFLNTSVSYSLGNILLHVHPISSICDLGIHISSRFVETQFSLLIYCGLGPSEVLDLFSMVFMLPVFSYNLMSYIRPYHDNYTLLKDIYVCVFVCYKSSAFLNFNFVVVVVEISLDFRLVLYVVLQCILHNVIIVLLPIKNHECNAGIINHFNLHDKIKHQSNIICNVLQSFHLCKELGKAWAILWTIEPDGCPHQCMGWHLS